MTNEYEQAVNLIKAFLIDFNCETGDTDYIEPNDLQALYEQGARRLLALTHPSGQRVLAVLSQDQTTTVTARAGALLDVQSVGAQLKAQGFRSVVQEKR